MRLVAFLVVMVGCGAPPCETEDAGTTQVTDWFVSETGVGGLRSVSVVGGRGWAAGGAGAVFTDDGGETWRNQSLGEVSDLYFDGVKTWISDGDGIARLDSTDGSPVGVSDAPVSMVDGRRTFFAAAGGTRCSSSDGTGWVCEAGSTLGATDVFVGAVGAWITSPGVIASWNGAAWTEVTVPGTPVAVAFGHGPDEAEDARGLAILADGGVLRSTDLGATWTPVEGASALGVRDLTSSDGVWWAAGDAGTVSRSTNDGATWVPLADGAGALLQIDVFEDESMPNTQVIAIGDGAAVVYGTHQVPDTGGGWGACL